MEDSFNIYIYSDDAKFCTSLALECNKYGFGLTFFDNTNLENVLNDDDVLISVVIIDLTTIKGRDVYSLGAKARISSDLPIFGVVETLSKKNQNEAKKYGFDLIFTKKMLLRSIKEVVIHIADNDE